MISREFKLKVYDINYLHVERALLRHENLQQTIRPLLLDAFTTSEPILTQTLKELHEQCSALFEKLLPRDDEPLDEYSFMYLRSDLSLHRPVVLDHLKIKGV